MINFKRKPSEILTEAKQLISSETNWTQKTYARNQAGVDIENILSSEAICFCSIGAVHRVARIRTLYQTATSKEVAYLDIAAEQLSNKVYENHQPTVAFNDSHTHAEVLALFDRAISLAIANGE